MPTDWLRQTQKRIDRALLCERLRTPGRMFLSSIGERLDLYHDNIRLSEAQHRKLNNLLNIAERDDPKATSRRHPTKSESQLAELTKPQEMLSLNIHPNELQPEPAPHQACLDLSQYFDASLDNFIPIEPLRLR